MTFYKGLCEPAKWYVIIALISIIIFIITKISSYGITSNMLLTLIFKCIYVIFCAWMLNLICRNGYKSLSWFLVLLPFVIFFILLSFLIYSF